MDQLKAIFLAVMFCMCCLSFADDINKCHPNPCMHGAVCNDDIYDYKCICKSGYQGKNCETDINKCNPNPCLHGAVCKDDNYDYKCICKSGYKGKNCEIEIQTMKQRKRLIRKAVEEKVYGITAIIVGIIDCGVIIVCCLRVKITQENP